MRGGLDHMMALAKKKPLLQKIVDEIANYPDDQIEQMEFPGWVRKCLKQYKVIEERNRRMAGMNIPGPKSEEHLIYDVYEYTGMDYQINEVGLGNGHMQFEINQYDIFFVHDNEHVKINSMAIYCTGKDRAMLLNNAKFVDRMSIIEYNEHLQKVLDRKYGFAVEDERNSEYGYLSAIKFY